MSLLNIEKRKIMDTSYKSDIISVEVVMHVGIDFLCVREKIS